MKPFFYILILFCLLTSCKDAVTSEYAEIPDKLPTDLRSGATTSEAATFAWDTFLAINAPTTDGTGTLWENYKEAYDIFLPNAETPTAWGKPSPGNQTVCDNINSNHKILRTTSKISPLVTETNQAVGGVLIDKNSNLVHYEVYMNKPMFEYVLKNQFYNALKQAGSEIKFPVGSMELKASWRILDSEKDDTSRYYTSKAIVYIPASDSIQKDSFPEIVKNNIQYCSEQLVGLVGLHIVYKTPSNPNFVWMTFEQNDNVETATTKKAGITPSFYDPSKAIDSCENNSRQVDCPKQIMTQVTRQNPIPDWVKKANTNYQEKLHAKKSVWEHYQLIGVQWPTDKTKVGNPILQNLANSSMETFNQTASSCIGCHAFARSSNPTIYSDFSWVMGRAKNPIAKLPEPNGADLLKYVMRVNPYKQWETWPDDEWNVFSKATPGENPHGKMIKIYVNDIALNAYKNNPKTMTTLPVGSIVLKENYRTTPPNEPHFSDLVELTIMYKAKDKNGAVRWFWEKARPFGPVDSASFDQQGCISCHMNWKGNGDGMLSFNFGKRPVITDRPFYTTKDEK
ncbi:MAG: cytochrome P460 family protein [Kordia sp.]|uniref:cytochrome P460 family protein n=1 Tax=Kordia sp. TaxID=1965332 RepID=UPI00385D32C9